jgi:benzodiazapine receptor
MESYSWYSQLIKPSWAPPSWIFGPVWSVLYVLIIISFGAAFKMFFEKQIPFVVILPFVLNIIFNLIFTPIQFGLKNLPLASLDILLVLGTLVWAMIAIYPYAKWISLVQIPYLLWVSFTIVQVSIHSQCCVGTQYFLPFWLSSVFQQ